MNKSFFLGAATAVGAVMLIPGVAAALARAGRPIAQAGLRTGAVAFDEFRKAGAEAYEHMEDMMAEIREDMHAHRAEDETAEGDIDPTATPGSQTTGPQTNAG